jgi:glycosyltransferase involved in cell wall biosynthesis
MPIRVAYSLVTLAPGRPGGSETYARAVLRRLTAGPEAAVVVIANPGVLRAPLDLGPHGAEVRRVRRPAGWTGLRARQAGMALEALAPRRPADPALRGTDVVHYPLTVPLPKAGLPTVVSLADLAHRDLPHLFAPAERAFRRWAYDASARRADVVVTYTEFMRDRIAEGLGIPRERFVVAPHGVEGRFSTAAGPDDAAVLESLGVRRPYCLYPANLWPHKNHARLLEAFREQPDPDTRLVLTGQRERRGRWLDERVRALGLEGRVSHLGHVADRAMPTLYRQAEMLVFPSLYEGFGVPVIEAMASGCPVVCSHAAALREVCGEAGRLVDPGDRDSIAEGIAQMRTDSALRQRCVEAGLRRSRSFTWELAADRHRLAYARAAG